MTNLDPRAKIGDRVGKAQLSPQEGVVSNINFDSPHGLYGMRGKKLYYKKPNGVRWREVKGKKKQDILKNLTTNKDYE